METGRRRGRLGRHLPSAVLPDPLSLTLFLCTSPRLAPPFFLDLHRLLLSLAVALQGQRGLLPLVPLALAGRKERHYFRAFPSNFVRLAPCPAKRPRHPLPPQHNVALFLSTEALTLSGLESRPRSSAHARYTRLLPLFLSSLSCILTALTAIMMRVPDAALPLMLLLLGALTIPARAQTAKSVYTIGGVDFAGT